MKLTIEVPDWFGDLDMFGQYQIIKYLEHAAMTAMTPPVPRCRLERMPDGRFAQVWR